MTSVGFQGGFLNRMGNGSKKKKCLSCEVVGGPEPHTVCHSCQVRRSTDHYITDSTATSCASHGANRPVFTVPLFVIGGYSMLRRRYTPDVRKSGWTGHNKIALIWTRSVPSRVYELIGPSLKSVFIVNPSKCYLLFSLRRWGGALLAQY